MGIKIILYNYYNFMGINYMKAFVHNKIGNVCFQASSKKMLFLWNI